MQGIDPRMMKQAMKRMGISQTEINAERVIIELSDSRIIIENPSVAKVNMMGETSYQISGDEVEQPKDSRPELSLEDIKTVAEQAGVDEDAAREALKEAEGDLAKAILTLKSS